MKILHRIDTAVVTGNDEYLFITMSSGFDSFTKFKATEILVINHCLVLDGLRRDSKVPSVS